MAKDQYALVIDESYDAVLLRDLLRTAAQKAHMRASKVTQRAALKQATTEYECFRKYADRCEQIRIDEAKRIGLKLGRPWAHLSETERAADRHAELTGDFHNREEK